ncbi:MAG: rhodanese-like domain-containing protein [Candidatus Binatia bacterium]
MKGISGRSCLVLPAALILGFLLQSTGVSANPPKRPESVERSLSKNIVPEYIHLEDLVDDIIDRKKPMIIDVRSRQAYRDSHIKASISIPLDELSEHLEEIPKDRLVVFYGNRPRHLASSAYRVLYQKGYRNMKVLYEGFTDWIKRGYPIEGDGLQEA